MSLPCCIYARQHDFILIQKLNKSYKNKSNRIIFKDKKSSKTKPSPEENCNE